MCRGRASCVRLNIQSTFTTVQAAKKRVQWRQGWAAPWWAMVGGRPPSGLHRRRDPCQASFSPDTRAPGRRRRPDPGGVGCLDRLGACHGPFTPGREAESPYDKFDVMLLPRMWCGPQHQQRPRTTLPPRHDEIPGEDGDQVLTFTLLCSLHDGQPEVIVAQGFGRSREARAGACGRMGRPSPRGNGAWHVIQRARR